MITLSVNELVDYIRAMFENDPILADVWVHGEVSNLKHHNSGHLYFTLKDQDAAISAVMWRSHVQRLGVDAIPEKGTAVLARGAVSVYGKSGQMQLYVHSLQPVGAGLLHAQFEAIRQALADEACSMRAVNAPCRRCPTASALQLHRRQRPIKICSMCCGGGIH